MAPHRASDHQRISRSPRRVFVSYSRSDFYFAEQLAVALRRRGLDVWFDVHELAPGSDWSEAIDRAIEECEVVVLVASRASLESPYVQRERDLADRLGRPQVAALAGRAAPGLPTYDLRSSFKRGAERLASDLAAGTPTGWRPRLRLPCPVGVAVYALAPALSVVCAAVLLALFLHRVIGHQVINATHVGVRLGLVGTFVALIGLPAAWVLWAFLRRRIGWLYLRGSVVTMPVVALVGVVSSEQMAAAIATLEGATLNALGVTPSGVDLLLGAEALAVLLLPVCLAAGVATEFSSGLYRFLRTGAAPRRIRSRHVGKVTRPDTSSAVRVCRLLAADDDAGVRDEVGRALAETGIAEAADGERDVVVLTDRTPAGWLSRDDLRDPVAVVATSIALPVRGALQRFQWVDYRSRRRRTLETLARDLADAAGSGAEVRAAPEVPERLERLRLPVAVVTVEWTLYSMAVVAAQVGAYGIALAVSHDRRELVWSAVACLVLAPVPFVLARQLRRRRLTPPLLVGLMTVFWAAVVPLGLDRLLRIEYASTDRGSFSVASPTYVAISAVVVAIAWRWLRRWLPRRIRTTRSGPATLGYARGSLLWVTMLVPAVIASAGTAVLAAPREPVEAVSARAADDICRDREGLEAFQKPVRAADFAIHRAAVRHAPHAVFIAAFERRIRVRAGAAHALQGYEPHGSWGTAMKTRLITGLARSVRADRGLLHREIDSKTWTASQRPFERATIDLAKPIC